MKKILLSIMAIALVATAGIYSTQAYFSDTETSKDNVIKAGTIDISVNNQNPWNETLLTEDMNDLKPGMQKKVTFTVKNEGANVLVLWKRVNITARSGGSTSEPEQEVDFEDTINDIDSKIHYDMTVGEVNTIPMAWDVMMSDVDQLWIPLGKVEAGASLDVTQIYKLDEETGNQYQGDQLTFDIDLYAEQLMGPGPIHTTRGLVMENKSLDPEWYSLMDGTWGIMTWDGSGDYTFKGHGLNNSLTYQLVYWNGSSEVVLGSTGTPVGGELNLSGAYAGLNTNPSAKYWLRPTPWSASSNANTLWESNLVN